MPIKTRLIATAIAIVIITAAVAVAKIEGSPALAVGTAVVGVAGFCILMASWNQRLRHQH